MERNSGKEHWLGDSDGPMGDVGAFMASELRVDRADLPGHIRQLDGNRNLIAIAGAPGAGKSRLARDICDALNAHEPGVAAILPMDGFHLDNATLDAAGLRQVKGAPETFDIDGFVALVAHAKFTTDDLTVPTFDRSSDAVIPDGDQVSCRVRFLLIEGNYLLLNRLGWRDLYPLFDLSIRIDVPEPDLRARLMRRWRDLPLAEATRRVEENDLANGRILRTEGRAADLVVRSRDQTPG